MTSGMKKKFQRNLLNWFRENHRDLPWRRTRDFYHIWLSEVMLQQTQVVKVIDYYQNFLDKFPTLFSLAKADLEQVLLLWQGLGYYSRARNFHRAAQKVVADYNGKIPENIGDFKKLPGVGDYIAAAVYSMAIGEPVPSIDGNVKRIVARIFEIQAAINTSAGEKSVKSRVSELFDESHPGEFNQAMMELGALTCKPQNPLCSQCPVKNFCQAFKNSSQGKFPIKIKKKPVPKYELAIGAIFHEDKFLLVKRNLYGMLGGLWEFPGGKIESPELAAEACERLIFEKLKLTAHVQRQIGNIEHTYSHFKIKGHVFLCQTGFVKPTLRDHDDFAWVNFAESERLPLHAIPLKIIDMLKKIVHNDK